MDDIQKQTPQSIIDEIIANVKDRLSSPVFGAFFIMLAAHYWEFLFYLITQTKKGAADKIQFAIDNYTSWVRFWWAIIFTALYLVLSPAFNALYRTICAYIYDKMEGGRAKTNLQTLNDEIKNKAELRDSIIKQIDVVTQNKANLLAESNRESLRIYEYKANADKLATEKLEIEEKITELRSNIGTLSETKRKLQSETQSVEACRALLSDTHEGMEQFIKLTPSPVLQRLCDHLRGCVIPPKVP